MLALGLRLASAPTANLSYVLIAIYALLGRGHAIRSLVMSWLFTMLNPGIAPQASTGSVGRYAVLFGAAASVLIHSGFLSGRPQMRPFTLSTILLGLFLIGHSLLFSPIVDVSVLKALSWTLAMTTLVSAWAGMSSSEFRNLEAELFWILVFSLLFSLPLSVFSVGYLVNGTGFQGIFNQPQVFGPTIAILFAWILTRMFGEYRTSWYIIALSGISIFSILMSEARTAGLAVVAALGLSAFLVSIFSGQTIGRMLPGLRSARIWMVLGMVLVGGVALAPRISDAVNHYITKSGRSSAASLTEAFDRSRGGLSRAMLQNITEQPWTGIGFGISSDLVRMKIVRDPIFGLPTGASVEKGVAPLMILEEVGILGALFVSLWLLLLLRSAVHSGLGSLAVCLTALLLNMGEATLFSPGGAGLLSMILFGWVYAGGISVHRLRHR